MTNRATLTIGDVRFGLEDEPVDGPRLTCDDDALRSLVILLNDAAIGGLGDPCRVADALRSGTKLSGGLGAIERADGSGRGPWKTWAPADDVDVSCAAVSVANPPFPSFVSAAWSAELFTWFSEQRRARLDRWVFRVRSVWCEPAPDEREAVQELDVRRTKILDVEPASVADPAYEEWLAAHDALLEELDRFGLSIHHDVLGFKRTFLGSWSCVGLLDYADEIARLAEWNRRPRRVRAVGVAHDATGGWVSASFFAADTTFDEDVLIAAERAARDLVDTPPGGTLEVEGHVVTFRRERGRAVVTSVRGASA